jgi:hypothetical protein
MCVLSNSIINYNVLLIFYNESYFYTYEQYEEDAILISLWHENEGRTDKNFSREDSPLHCLTAADTLGIPLWLSYFPVPN